MELSDEDSNFEMIEMSTIILEIGKYLASSFDFCCILPVYCKAQKLTENMLIQFDLLASKNDSATESQTRQNRPFSFFYFAFLREKIQRNCRAAGVSDFNITKIVKKSSKV